MEFKCKLLILAVIIGVMHLRMVYPQIRESQKYCGGQIGKALSTICKGNYNTIKRITKIPRPVYIDDMYSDMPAARGESLEFPFQTKAEATSLLGKRRRKRTGVYTECCEKSCTREELSSYCAQGKRRR
ncbi:bombyxin F-1 [Diorhabda sublineata]|uniref:bombyxin F-1 n=1 Tax=Diorhabda sublineata TaxID=1163346 RepID=UPI0024E0E091|nr:bombyxin F-1 [Diorhabda sublineata]